MLTLKGSHLIVKGSSKRRRGETDIMYAASEP